MTINTDNYLAELKKKNPLVIEFVVNEYGSLIRSVIKKYLFSNEFAVSECFNDVLLAIWNNPDKFDNKKGHFKNWICAIAKYRAIDTLRREVKYYERFVSVEAEDDIDWLNTFCISENGAEITDSSAEELEKLLKCLSEDDKDLFFRRYADDQSIDEIAKEKSMSRNQIYTRLSRGKGKIKSHIEFKSRGVINE